MLAVCQPVAVRELVSRFGTDVLERLEEEGAIVSDADGRRQLVRLGHPEHRATLRAGVSDARARSLMLDHADALEDYGARRRQDPVRIATLRLEAAGRADPDLLVRGALSARAGDDLADVVRLAGAAFDVRPSALAGLLLAEALHHLGELDRADDVLGRVVALATHDDVARRAVELRARNRHVAGRIDPAIDLPHTVEAEILAHDGRPARRWTCSSGPTTTAPTGPRMPWRRLQPWRCRVARRPRST